MFKTKTFKHFKNESNDTRKRVIFTRLPFSGLALPATVRQKTLLWRIEVVLRKVGQAFLRELRLGDQRLQLDTLRAILGLARRPLLGAVLFCCSEVAGWVGRRGLNIHPHTAKGIE